MRPLVKRAFRTVPITKPACPTGSLNGNRFLSKPIISASIVAYVSLCEFVPHLMLRSRIGPPQSRVFEDMPPSSDKTRADRPSRRGALHRAPRDPPEHRHRD